ncbi:MAG: hypothetical protein KGD73_11820 [Candidatus Lokiarchaeota archaeon]|nr:hypothetical protein [Candidatus Lokiarchaeota archaeon]
MNLKIEYYPKLPDSLLSNYLSIIKSNKKNWDDPFFSNTKSHIDFDLINEKLSSIDLNQIKNVIILGTGGSIQTFLALSHLSHKKIYPITSSRSFELINCLELTKPSDSIVIPISRGGETLDVNSTIEIFAKKGYPFIGLSSKGTMLSILEDMKAPILDVPDLSGRFAASISNVGIVPALISGINVDMVIKGLDQGYSLFMTESINPAIEFAAFLYSLYEKGISNLFSMPYTKSIEGAVGLFVQEISESTGKNNKGLMGTYQSAPLCQHSVLEFLLGGKSNKVTPILWIMEKVKSDIILDSNIDYINGKSAHTIINYQAVATFQALIEQGLPSAMISLKEDDELNLGNLIAFIQATVYHLCLLLNVNWSDNPKVVIGKKICNEALLNQKQFDDLQSEREKIARNRFTGYYSQ